MSVKMAKYFIATALLFFLIGCIEGMMFPTKFQFQPFYSAVFQVPAEHIKSFFCHFVAKIHTHVNLIGWVGSALMGILYFIAPQISGTERYTPWVAYANWGCQTVGIILLSVGFHLIGVFGLSSGFTAGSPEFRSVAAPFKMVVTAGGLLITISALLFAYNMVRTLFGQTRNVHSEKASAAGKNRLKRARSAVTVIFLAAAVGLIVATPVRQATASPVPAPERADVIMIGDRLVDVAYNLGVVPAAMSVRCSLWPMCEHLKTAVQVLGCPKCLSKKKAAPLLKFAQQHGIKRILIEKSDPFCEYVPELKLEAIANLVESKGLEIDFIDFTRGLEDAVRQTATLFGRRDKADDVMARYTEAMEKTRAKMAGKQFPKKVVIISGTYQPTTGKAFLRIEVPGGYADRFLLQPMGIENIGNLILLEKKTPSKGHVAIRKLDGLVVAAPDAIVMTGDAVAVQKAIVKALKQNPALAQVPAIKAHAVYSLPGYVGASVIEYPQILRRWADLLSM
jgi:hypothetical protein